jgi:hypothetical protein
VNQRLEFLVNLVSGGSTDPFHAYALANEYRKERRLEDALRTYEGLRAAHPDYLPMYYMAGTLLAELSRPEDARAWFAAGIELAGRLGNAKTAHELADAQSKL